MKVAVVALVHLPMINTVVLCKGIFTWSDGDQHEGEWKDGERHGKGIFCNSDWSVEYSMYEAGRRVRTGVRWSADQKTAKKLTPEQDESEMSLPAAQKFAKECAGINQESRLH